MATFNGTDADEIITPEFVSPPLPRSAAERRPLGQTPSTVATALTPLMAAAAATSSMAEETATSSSAAPATTRSTAKKITTS